jgi:hypothetical protein
MTKDKTVTMSRETLGKCLRDALLIRFEQDSHVEQLRALLAAPVVERQPEPVAVVPSLWYIRVPDEPENPESPCEYFYAGSEWHRDQLLSKKGASIADEYACLDKVKEMNK